MNILKLAIDSGIPLIKVTTDDVINVSTVLSGLVGREFFIVYDRSVKEVDFEETNYTYWVEPLAPSEHNYEDMYEELSDAESVIVLVNPSFEDPLMFDAGVLLPTEEIVIKHLEQFDPDNVEELAAALAGLSLKDITEIVRLTQTESGSLTTRGVMNIRRLYVGQLDGLEQVNLDNTYYDPPEFLTSWVSRESQFFLDKEVHPELVPRGLVFDGDPGLGKTQAAKYLASTLGVPLYRLDIGGVMNKYIGSSEANFSKALNIVDQSGPCIVLFDEIDRMIRGDGGDDGVVDRIISMLLWWLQEHSSRVLTILTTNHLESLPAEVYRAGRMDAVHVFQGVQDINAKKKFLVKKIDTLHNLEESIVVDIVENIVQKDSMAGVVSYASLVQQAILGVKEYYYLTNDTNQV